MLCGGVELFQQLLGAHDKLLKQFWGRSTSATGLKPGVNETRSRVWRPAGSYVCDKCGVPEPNWNAAFIRQPALSKKSVVRPGQSWRKKALSESGLTLKN